MSYNTIPLFAVYTAFVLLLGGLIGKFSANYMMLDKKKDKFLLKLLALILLAASVAGVAVLSNNIFLVIVNLLGVKIILSQLLLHMPVFSNSREFQIELKRHNYICMGLGLITCILFFLTCGSLKLTTFNHCIVSSSLKLTTLCSLYLFCLLFMGMPPFSRWLFKSVDSVTPVSALMHAGVLGAPALLLMLAAPSIQLSLEFQWVMVTFSLIGILWGIGMTSVQIDYKSRLVCSTIIQFSFMLLQISLGLYASALLHMILHAFYKAYCFLNMGNAGTKQAVQTNQVKLLSFCAIGVTLFLIQLLLNIQITLTLSMILLFFLQSFVQRFKANSIYIACAKLFKLMLMLSMYACLLWLIKENIIANRVVVPSIDYAVSLILLLSYLIFNSGVFNHQKQLKMFFINQTLMQKV